MPDAAFRDCREVTKDIVDDWLDENGVDAERTARQIDGRILDLEVVGDKLPPGSPYSAGVDEIIQSLLDMREALRRPQPGTLIIVEAVGLVTQPADTGLGSFGQRISYDTRRATARGWP